MSFTTFWSPNQAAISQVETYTFTAPSGVGNTYNATTNGKTVTYTSVSGDTAATAAAGLYALLNLSAGIAPELTEIAFANPSSAVMTATARTPGTPFANVPGTAAGLVLSTGNGLVNGIATVHTVANQSPSDANDPQNWLRVNLSNTPPSKTRSLPQNGDNGVVAGTTVPMLWNLDQLASVQFATYQRWQSMTGDIGLPDTNANGYSEWRATYLRLSGPQGSVPAGGLVMTLGYTSSSGASGAGPGRERYDAASQQVTLNILAAGQAEDDYGVLFLGQHTQNTFNLNGGVSLGIAMQPSEKANLASATVDNGTLGIGGNVAWTAGSTLTMDGGTALLNAAPATLALANGAAATIATDALVWPAITMQGGCSLSFMAGGTITALTMTNSCTLDKSGDGRSLVITNHTLDGDTCVINDPLNAITFTNAGTVKQSVASGPYLFTGPRTVKVT